MITSINASRPAAAQSNPRAGTVTDGNNDVLNYYSALLRHVQIHQAALGASSYALGVTSCDPKQGYETVAANLAIAAARSGAQQVLLVDADGKSSATALLHVKSENGLAEVLGGANLLGDALQATPVDGLRALAVGNPSMKLGLDFSINDFNLLLDELKSEFDLIVFSLPLADELSECYSFAQALDGVFMAIHGGHTDTRLARRATQRLEHSQAWLLGAIYLE